MTRPLKTGQPDYKNWMPPGILCGLIGGAALCTALFFLLKFRPVLRAGIPRTALLVFFLAAGLILAALAFWMTMLRRAFSYTGKRQMARQIIQGVAQYVRLPDGGVGLDVGCGSGALTIACAKRNPRAGMIGIDTWGKTYTFSKELCERNAEAEGVGNVEFRRGNALRLDFPDETFDAVVSNYVYHNIFFSDRQALLLETLRTLKKGGCFAIHDLMSPGPYGDIEKFADSLRRMGYREVKLIKTSDGIFMTKREGRLLALSGSTLLTGIK